MVAQGSPGVLAPIHVQKHMMKGLIKCTDRDCQTIMENMEKDWPSMECQHLRATMFPIKMDIRDLTPAGLEHLLQRNIISSTTACNLKEMREISAQNKTTLVVYADFSIAAYNDRMKYYSVYTGTTTYFSMLGRVRVTFDSESGCWSCLCPSSGECKQCIHEAAAKWYVADYQEELMRKTNR